MRIKRLCKFCKKEYFAEKREINRGKGIFCSHSCSSLFYHKNKEVIKKIPNVKCANCKKDFYKSKLKQKNSKSGLFFCCRACKDKAQRIGGIKEIQPNHYTNKLRSTSHKGLIKRIKGINFCEKCGYNKHIEILQIHHKDRDRNNGDLENLIVLCPNCHLWEHYTVKDGLYNNRKGA